MGYCDTTKRAGRAAAVIMACSLIYGCPAFDTLHDPPGKGPTAEAWFERCKPLIDSLERYKTVNRRYPAALSDLVPGYADAVPQEDLKQGALLYQKKKQSYELRFKYYGPGVNTCVFRPESKWYCSGYY